MNEDFDLSAFEQRLDEQEKRERELIEKHARKNLKLLLKRLKAFTEAELSTIESDLREKKSGVADAAAKTVSKRIAPLRQTSERIEWRTNLFGWLSLTGISLLLLLSLLIYFKLPAGAPSGRLDRSKIVQATDGTKLYPVSEIPAEYWKKGE